MRYFSLVVFLAFVAASAQTPSSNPPAAAVPSSFIATQTTDPNAVKARALLDQMIQAMGGQAYMSVQDMQQEGRTYSFFQGKPNSVGAPFWRFWKFPDKDRVELTKQRDIVYINVGDRGYEVTYKGTAPQEREQLEEYVRRREHSLETVLRIWLQQKDTALFYDGPAVAEQKPCDSVTILDSKNDSVTIFIDRNSHLPVKKTWTWRDPLDNLKNEEGEIYDNFKSIGGVLIPHSILRTRNGDITNQRFLTVTRVNAGVPDSLFQTNVTYDPYKKSSK
ncbi:MAG TPA: hypothetical protein VEG30_10510 [Terriglobales bacterium]|nr:hypothetical protein [Terriglobales bacterium]